MFLVKYIPLYIFYIFSKIFLYISYMNQGISSGFFYNSYSKDFSFLKVTLFKFCFDNESYQDVSHLLIYLYFLIDEFLYICTK